ncbi:Ribosomal-protein-alanine N-acetyltransferase [Alteripontixanthobacter maritimus]|uniref:Ribosomal-protein-alanine N-acetyltransferase n=1 Tax=Alteripontixanthobacter maritimus TaxID=2161824 RepID=A0A369Q8T0_9SPHN|nr:GNAT family N-acetyltransferase [Alteripontixanthobacter maritimus]RDC61124.1 Ribosomal-protein-alanine N-acetyltransferase [Alteripontixanthobacter maritimus]
MHRRRRDYLVAEEASPFRLETERLILRDWRDEDWPEFWRVTNTPAVMRWLGDEADAATRDAARARLEGYRSQHGHTFWVLQRKDDGGHLSGEMLGFCGLKRSNVVGETVEGMMEVGWRLREDAWGSGYAKEAAVASLDTAFNRFGADEVVALTVAGNKASWGLMVRLGMQRREDLDFTDPRYGPHLNPSIVYAVTFEQWQE